MSKHPVTDSELESPAYFDAALQRARNQSAINLLNEWLADESGYDEQVWPSAKKAIAENSLSPRKRFDD
jgi:hypothetical protein